MRQTGLTLLALSAVLGACSVGADDAGSESDVAGSEDVAAAVDWQTGPPMDGTPFGASSEGLARVGKHPIPSAEFVPTSSEIETLQSTLRMEASDRSGDASPTLAFRAATVDLNGDGRNEFLVLLADRNWCGSGGCTFRVYEQSAKGLRKVSGSTVTRVPIGVKDGKSNGWRDITVFICGGGLNPCGRSKLRFDGERYPLNPSMPPAERTDEVGTVVLNEESPLFHVFKQEPLT